MKSVQSQFSKLKIAMLVLVVSSFMYHSNISAQKLEITPFYGYQLNGKVIGYSGDLNIRDASNYGVMLDIAVQNGMQVELFYSRSDTRADFVEFRGPTYKLTNVSVNYFQLGFLRTAKKIDNISLYGVGSLGATLFSPSGQDYNETPKDYYFQDWWLFSVTLGGGAKVWISKKVGLRFEGRLLMPITWAGGGFMIGTGGSGLYLGGGSAILQASLTAGIIIALGK
ncbi:Multi antimicrobial extrusion protein (Na(+)/drug antiporter), MATE family of MDR efflux pumps [hydrothermal vent metagenome]|uniref:Multi antimicrobial extrusion protein (Na(+)/drug antiporter), MATE family of MDR efflux pumps n=1 Tax=hydrothermal vent metagenome TaxID=652676 RepID=A0A3B1CXW5_9ZZZZ